MNSNLDNIDSNIDNNFQFIKIKSEIYNNVLNIKYSDYLKTLNTHYYKTYIHISLLYFGLLSTITINTYLTNFFSSNLANTIFFVINSLFVGLFIHGLQQALHVGLHYELHSNKKINDKISTILGILTGVNVKQARIIHMKHHSKHGEKDDPENSYLYPLTFYKILKFFTGVSIVQYCLNIDKNVSPDKVEDKLYKTNLLIKIKTFLTMTRIISIAVHSIIFCLIYLNSNLFFALSWVYGFLTFFPFFASLLNIIEHGENKKTKIISAHSSDPINRLFENSFFSKYIYAPFGAYKHAIHHWDPTVHHNQVDQIENFLINTQLKESVEKRKTSILETIKAVI